MKKILIFGMPRTGTTILQHLISKELGLPNLLEPYSDYEIGRKYIDWTKAVRLGVIKSLTMDSTRTVDSISVTKLVEQIDFDGIVVTQRKNLLDTCLSLYYANKIVDKYQWGQDEEVVGKNFLFDLNFFDIFWREYKMYQTTIDWLDQTNQSYEIFDYDLFMLGQSQKVLTKDIHYQKSKSPFKKSELCYRDLCSNLNQVENILRLHLNKSH